jgi:hypothetical protein
MNQHDIPLTLQDKNNKVTFAGALVSPNEVVTIEAYDPQTKQWSTWPGATATSGSYIWPPGSARYGWAVHKVIPSQYWARDQECAATGESALVRSKWGSVYLKSFALPGFWDCYSANPDPVAFMANCPAPESPNVLIPSLNYRDYGIECAERINTIRKIEGKPPLQIHDAGECGADSDAKCNYEWELTHPQPHHCPGPGAQNECDYKGSAGSIDQILDTCIWKKMYEAEKKCYQQNPTSSPCADDNCYYDENCMCGHYVNMVVCPNYTKVSCGVYEFQDNYGNWRYKAVQNFM